MEDNYGMDIHKASTVIFAHAVNNQTIIRGSRDRVKHLPCTLYYVFIIIRLVRSGQYCQSRAEYFPVLPSYSCNNIYVLRFQSLLPLSLYYLWLDIAVLPTNGRDHILTHHILPAITNYIVRKYFHTFNSK